MDRLLKSITPTLEHCYYLILIVKYPQFWRQITFIQAVISGTGSDFGIIEHTQHEYEKKSQEEDVIAYTSGLGGLFKPGIPIGKIKKEQSGKVKFFSDFTQLNYVKITSYEIGSKK